MASYIGPRIGIYKMLLAANGIAVFSNLIKVIETSVTVFKKMGVTLVIRLNKPQYDKK